MASVTLDRVGKRYPDGFRAVDDFSLTIEDGEFIEIHVDTPIEVAEARDPKGLYKKAREGKIANFTGIDSPYERPERPELRLDASTRSPEDLADEVLRMLADKGYVQ